MREYELVTIFQSEEEPVRAGRENVKAQLGAIGAEIVKEDDMGDRELAYPIRKKPRGRYFLYTVKVDQSKIPQAEKHFKLDTNLLKYLFVRKEE